MGVLLFPMSLGVVTRDAGPHHPNAIDISCVVGQPVRAAHPGTVERIYSHTHGLSVVLTSLDGLTTMYSHLHSATPTGTTLQRGDQLGSCGNSGTWTTGPHLHFEVVQM